MIWAKLGSLMMFLAVALGAFGAHALRDKLSPASLDIYKTAVLYHFLHALGLFFVAWLFEHQHDPRLNISGILLLLGMILFCGSLYLLSLTGYRWIGALTPLGGLMFLGGWLLIFLTIKI